MINLNGTLLSENSKVFTVENRAFKYGDALFETIRVVDQKVVFLEDHYFRLMASMRILRMNIPMEMTMEYLENEVVKTIKSNNINDARVRLTIFRKSGGFYDPISNHIDYLIEVSLLNRIIKDVYTIDIFKDHFLQSGLLATLKTTNRIPNVLASIYASENGFDNCIMINEKKYVAEAINGNIFMVVGNTIKTPPVTEGCIKGIMRKKIIELISKNNRFNIEEVAISPFELQKADELFVTNVIVGIQPVTNYKKKMYNRKVSSEISKKLCALV